MKAKIGIVICGISNQRQFISDSYVQAIKVANGLPIILPLIKSNEAIASYIELCDGFLFCGGGDITPLLFGKEPARGIGETNITLDIFQIRLMKAVLASRKPILAICRGIQILNVACKGTIFQDLARRIEPTINHMQNSISRKDISHKVTFLPCTHLNRILGNFAYTNSFHHQAIEYLGDGLIVSGQTADGVIEAIEMPSHPFVVGVQWHPESMFRTNSGMKQLFLSLVWHAERN